MESSLYRLIFRPNIRSVPYRHVLYISSSLHTSSTSSQPSRPVYISPFRNTSIHKSGTRQVYPHSQRRWRSLTIDSIPHYEQKIEKQIQEQMRSQWAPESLVSNQQHGGAQRSGDEFEESQPIDEFGVLPLTLVLPPLRERPSWYFRNPRLRLRFEWRRLLSRGRIYLTICYLARLRENSFMGIFKPGLIGLRKQAATLYKSMHSAILSKNADAAAKVMTQGLQKSTREQYGGQNLKRGDVIRKSQMPLSVKIVAHNLATFPHKDASGENPMVWQAVARVKDAKSRQSEYMVMQRIHRNGKQEDWKVQSMFKGETDLDTWMKDYEDPEAAARRNAGR